jgi:hypothetical protein
MKKVHQNSHQEYNQEQQEESNVRIKVKQDTKKTMPKKRTSPRLVNDSLNHTNKIETSTPNNTIPSNVTTRATRLPPPQQQQQQQQSNVQPSLLYNNNRQRPPLPATAYSKQRRIVPPEDAGVALKYYYKKNNTVANRENQFEEFCKIQEEENTLPVNDNVPRQVKQNNVSPLFCNILDTSSQVENYQFTLPIDDVEYDMESLCRDKQATKYPLAPTLQQLPPLQQQLPPSLVSPPQQDKQYLQYQQAEDGFEEFVKSNTRKEQ